jgi:hypothetical protein
VKATWRTMLDGSREEALLAVDLSLQPDASAAPFGGLPDPHAPCLALFASRPVSSRPP